MKCIKCIMEVGGYFSVENRTSSYLWSLPGFKRLAHRVGSYKVRLHQCEYGLCFPDAPSKRCRKDTTILANFPEIMNLHVLWHLCLWWPFGVPGKQAGRRPIVTLVRRGLGGEKCPCGFLPWVCAGCSTRPGRPLWGRDACQDTASTEVERELKSTGGLRLACGRRQSGGMVQPGVSRGGISEASRFFFAGASACLNSRLARVPSVVPATAAATVRLVVKKKKLHVLCSHSHEHVAALGGIKTPDGWTSRSKLAGAYPPAFFHVRLPITNRESAFPRRI